MAAHRPDPEWSDASPGADVAATHCSRCGAAFVCGIDEPGGCWCARLPVLPAAAVAADAGCLCEACLVGLTAAFARTDG
jgi:hypothetical protein